MFVCFYFALYHRINNYPPVTGGVGISLVVVIVPVVVLIAAGVITFAVIVLWKSRRQENDVHVHGKFFFTNKISVLLTLE